MTGQTPIAKFKAGQISSALWENEIEVKGKTVTILKATVQRRYKDKDGNWQSASGFGKNDLPKLALVVNKSFEFLAMSEREPQSEENGKNPEA